MRKHYYWTEFYIPDEFRDVEPDESIQIRIGTSAPAGLICSPCGVPQVIHSIDIHLPYKGSQHEKCPGCGQNFTDPFYTFSWTMLGHKRRLGGIAQEEAKRYRHHPQEDWCRLAIRQGKSPVVDSDGKRHSATNFLKHIENYYPMFSSA